MCYARNRDVVPRVFKSCARAAERPGPECQARMSALAGVSIEAIVGSRSWYALACGLAEEEGRKKGISTKRTYHRLKTKEEALFFGRKVPPFGAFLGRG